MIRKLRQKFILINMLIVTVMLCVIFGFVYSSTEKSLERESISMMRTVAHGPEKGAPPESRPPEPRLPHFSLQLSSEGEILSVEDSFFDLSDTDWPERLVETALASPGEIGVLREERLRFCRMNTPTGITLVFADMSGEISTLHNLVKTSALIGLLSLLLFLGISFFLARWAVRPVAEAWERQKQFVADASHELKTPLAVIMTNSELLQSGDYTEDERRRFSHGIHIMSRQMRSLLENMLELVKADSDRSPLRRESLDFSDLVLSSALSFEGVFAEGGLSLECRVEPGIRLSGEQRALQQVVDILLDNAGKYTAPGGRISLSLRAVGPCRCRLCLSNPGESISPEELKRIFRRFYRLDKARSRNGSFGLGLSIAEAIVQRHKGRIWAESRGGINSFYVELHRDSCS